jgi:hypothetical protein
LQKLQRSETTLYLIEEMPHIRKNPAIPHEGNTPLPILGKVKQSTIPGFLSKPFPERSTTHCRRIDDPTEGFEVPDQVREDLLCFTEREIRLE